MRVLPTALDTTSADYQERYAAMAAAVEAVRAEIRKARETVSGKAAARLRALGKGTAHERLAQLLDPGAPFLELSPLAALGVYDGVPAGAGMVTGIGRVAGRTCMVTANDPAVKGGTIFPLGVKKFLRAQAIARENRLPLVYLTDSGGAFLPLQSELFPDREHGGRIFFNQSELSRLGIPQIAVVLGPCTAGGAYIPALSDQVIMVRGTGFVFLGGPPLVKAATGEEVTAEELGGAEVHCSLSGVSDYLADSEAEALALARELVQDLPAPARAEPAAPDEPLYDPRELYGLVGTDLRRPFEVREVIARLADGSRFAEFKRDYGPTLVTGWADIHGYRVGVLANNGVLFSESAHKATEFILLCDRDATPLLFLQNITGFMIGRDYEQRGITKDGAKMVMAVSNTRSPKLTVVIGGSFGAGNYGMCGRAFDPRFLWMWPQARISVMGGEQAAGTLVQVKREQLERSGQSLSEEMVQFMKAAVLEVYDKESSALHSTARLWDDGILDPAETRTVLGLALSVVAGGEPRPSAFGVFRM
jgi:acetyl-CoA carboxylase carboxyltransferase component